MQTEPPRLPIAYSTASFYPLCRSLCQPSFKQRGLGSHLGPGRRLPHSWRAGHRRWHRTRVGWANAGSDATCPRLRGSAGAARGTGPAPSGKGAGAAGKEGEVGHSPALPSREGDSSARPYLGSALEVEGEHVLPTPGLALAHQEHTMGIRALQLNQLCSLHPGDGAMEPGVAGQEMVRFLAGWVQQRPRRRTWQRRWVMLTVGPCVQHRQRTRALTHLGSGSLCFPSGSWPDQAQVWRERAPLRLCSPGCGGEAGCEEQSRWVRVRAKAGVGLTLGTAGAQPSTSSAAAHLPLQR